MTTPKEALEYGLEAVRESFASAKTRDEQLLAEARYSAIESALASLEGDAVERVARIIDPTFDVGIDESPARKTALRKSRAILATGLMPDEAAVRADEREKMLDKVCENLIVLSRGDESIIGAARVALNNAAVFICGADRAKRAIRSGGGA